jgi:hypothetical protein
MADPKTLIPFVAKEAIDLQTAAQIAGKSAETVRNWCLLYHLGRRVAGGPWLVSRIALAAFLDGDMTGLKRYLEGDRQSEGVRAYIKRLKLSAWFDDPS